MGFAGVALRTYKFVNTEDLSVRRLFSDIFDNFDCLLSRRTHSISQVFKWVHTPC